MGNSLVARLRWITVILVLAGPVRLCGQQLVAKETLGKEYFDNGNFEKALPVFAKLAQSYPDNAMYNYYYGVCLIKNNIFETAAKEALLNSVVDKTPANANFYLGNYFHALNDWQEAMDFYDRYNKAGTKQEKKLLNFDRLVSLCQQKVNPFTPRKVDNALFGDSIMKPPPPIDEKIFPIPDELKKAWFNFQVNDLLAYHSIEDFKSEAGKILFTKAWICTGKNDSILVMTDTLRKQHDRVNRVDTRLGLVQQIVDCEQKSYQLMRDREKFLDQSRVKESGWWDKQGKAAASTYNYAILERERILAEKKKNLEKQEEPVTPPVIADTNHVTVPPVQPTQEVTDAKKKIENVTFKVQVGSFKNGVIPPSYAKLYARIGKLRKIDKLKDAKNFVIYTIGNFTKYTDATKMKDQLILEGLKGSFVVAYQNGQKIAVNEVVKLGDSK